MSGAKKQTQFRWRPLDSRLVRGRRASSGLIVFLETLFAFAKCCYIRLLRHFLFVELACRCVWKRKKYTSERVDNVLQIG